MNTMGNFVLHKSLFVKKDGKNSLEVIRIAIYKAFVDVYCCIGNGGDYLSVFT